jgi:hypothetical protein
VLDAARGLEINGQEIVFATVQAVNGRESLLLTGTAESKGNLERAAVLAVLDATNRWTDARRPV